mmetsp:Transcript_71837/g.126556  ORF Transcript_71837/g.126556 Transcript_71837/m.126556 type:complete len:215 (-) Transcript_71837:128-772(-)
MSEANTSAVSDSSEHPVTLRSWDRSLTFRSACGFSGKTSERFALRRDPCDSGGVRHRSISSSDWCHARSQSASSSFRAFRFSSCCWACSISPYPGSSLHRSHWCLVRSAHTRAPRGWHRSFRSRRAATRSSTGCPPASISSTKYVSRYLASCPTSALVANSFPVRSRMSSTASRRWLVVMCSLTTARNPTRSSHGILPSLSRSARSATTSGLNL